MFSKRSKFFNSKGFSLIELMVVVAIIGILASIGIPQYSKFQAKTRQSEAKGSLATLFTAETSFMGEWNQYSSNLKNIGFGVAGSRLRYVTGFVQPAGVAGVACAGYSTVAGAPAEGAAENTAVTWMPSTLSCGANVNIGVSPATFAAPTGWTFNAATTQCGAVPALPAGTTSSCDANPGTQAFRGVALGDPNANVGAVNLDGWTINQLKVLANSTPGIQ